MQQQAQSKSPNPPLSPSNQYMNTIKLENHQQHNGLDTNNNSISNNVSPTELISSKSISQNMVASASALSSLNIQTTNLKTPREHINSISPITSNKRPRLHLSGEDIQQNNWVVSNSNS